MIRKLERQIFFKNLFVLGTFLFFIELTIRFNTGCSFFDWSTLRIFISSYILSSLYSLFIMNFKNRTVKILNTIISFLLTVYAWVEVNLFSYIGFFMGVGNAEQGTKIVDYIKDFIVAAKWQSYLFIIPFVLYLIYIWYIEKKINEYLLNKTAVFKFENSTLIKKVYSYVKAFIIILLLSGVYYFTLISDVMQNKLQVIDNTKLILSNENPNLSVSQFGVYIYGLSDIAVNTFNITREEDIGDIIANQNGDLIKDKTREIDDSAWEYLIQNENRNIYKKLNDYFINREITPKNEKTGIFEGKNLIVILMESVNYISIDKDRYPTIYKLWSEGISFRNNYSPRNNCSTGNNEMTVMTSLYTINHTCTANKYKNNIYPEAIFNMFNDLGYKTTSYHNYSDHYYSRKTIHKNMGSGQYYNAGDLKIKWSSVYEEWPSDVDFITQSVPKFIYEDKFMVFMSSVTTHQPYMVSSEYGDKNLDKLSDTDYSKSVKRYMSKMYELDKALELLLQELEISGKLDDTVIALFCDHYPYGLSNKDINTVLDYDVNVNLEVDRTPMIIYNSKIDAEVIYEYTSIIDLLPTLLNMFNVSYDPRLYLGYDIFSDYDHRTYFADGSWQDKVGFYSASKGKFIPSGEEVYTSEEIKEINNEIILKQSMSSLAIKNDYFNYLFKKINEYSELLSNKDLESEE